MDIASKIQTIYNLCFNPKFRGGAEAIAWLKLDNNEVVVYPQAIDVKSPINKWNQIKWELTEEGKVINLTYTEDSTLNKVYIALSDYIRHTE